LFSKLNNKHLLFCDQFRPTKNVGLFGKCGLSNHKKRKSQDKNRKKTKKTNSRHRRVFNRLPEGEEWALKSDFSSYKV
tara:strand:+ start:81 stop:314 length:234 start_codon:yes stop_codon:yes gene_type:complete